VLAIFSLLMFAVAALMLLQMNREADAPTPIAITATVPGTFTPLAPATTTATRTTDAPATTTLRPTPTQFVPGEGGPPKATETAAPGVTPGSTSTATETVNVYLIALGDDGDDGSPAGCGDSLIPVEYAIPEQSSVEGRITAALNILFGIDDRTVGDLYNALYRSTLSVERVGLESDTAVVALSGDIRVDDDCDRSRLEAQLETTIGKVGAAVQSVRVTLNGVPIEDVLYGGN
jgi:hypothetical protein